MFSHFSTIAYRLVTDRQTHDDSIYRASISSRGKMGHMTMTRPLLKVVLPRDTILARYMMSACVCPSVFQSVCPSHARIIPKRLWPAELTFIGNCLYQQFELLISAIIVDISN